MEELLSKIKLVIKYLLRRFQHEVPQRGCDCIEDPVFVFAACWRTGSTLFQRIINASGEVLIWGEPSFLQEATALHKRVDAWFDKVDWNRMKLDLDQVGQWIPVASPSKAYVTNAFQAFFSELYVPETEEFQRKRWGFKEVRANAVSHMLFLNKIFPSAKFIFLVRDPYDTYRSVKGKDFFTVFKNPYQPVRIWKKNVKDFLSCDEIKDKSLLVRYEDLCNVSESNQQLLKQICEHLEVPLTDKMFEELKAKTDSSGTEIKLDQKDLNKMAEILGDIPSSVGYQIQRFE